MTTKKHEPPKHTAHPAAKKPEPPKVPPVQPKAPAPPAEQTNLQKEQATGQASTAEAKERIDHPQVAPETQPAKQPYEDDHGDTASRRK